MIRIIIISLVAVIILAIIATMALFLSRSTQGDDVWEPTLGESRQIVDAIFPNTSDFGATIPRDATFPNELVFTGIPEYLIGVDGGVITVERFLSDAEVASYEALYKDWDEGDVVWHSYQLRSQEDEEETRYEIHYYPPYAFNVVIFEQPFDEVRREAELVFMRRLGVSEDIACRIDVMVVVPPYIDESLSGRNLGLSFCPNAEPLWMRSR